MMKSSVAGKLSLAVKEVVKQFAEKRHYLIPKYDCDDERKQRQRADHYEIVFSILYLYE